MALVLVIDGDRQICSLMQTILLRNGHEVLTAMTGEDGLQLAEQYAVDVVIVDDHLPRMTAATVCARLRGSPTTAHVPIILSSTRFNIDSQTYLAELGADMLLSKPFRPDDLLSLFAQFSL